VKHRLASRLAGALHPPGAVVGEAVVDPEPGARAPGGAPPEARQHGRYATLAEPYAAPAAELQRHDIKMGPVSWEVYLGDPAKLAPDELTTQVFMQVSPEDAARIG